MPSFLVSTFLDKGTIISVTDQEKEKKVKFS